ncbi:GDP-D-glucose phosphorylase 1 [Uranotaenia lowii]|uniref:GDP-D-glucose phosphorylase 1 n=1 Tax=Uranotaenia lowii TaxID=190385 RepID=UPI00247AA92E|nr:GDP-D-glucose phosphorylase 1 [Uranotaenia lowii]
MSAVPSESGNSSVCSKMAIDSLLLDAIPNLKQLLESAWARAYAQEGLFRYRLDVELERMTTGRFRFLLQLNRKRTTERRKPDVIDGLRPNFDPSRFNFTKVASGEILLELMVGESVVSLLINNSPLTENHVLIVPDRVSCLPQILTESSLNSVIRILVALGDPNYSIGYNSSGALASVNHLHFHLVYLRHPIYIEQVNLIPLANGIFRLDDSCPARGYCLVLESGSSREVPRFVNRLFRIIQTLLEHNVAHNLYLTRRTPDSALRVFIYPRLRLCENKQIAPFNVAGFEMSGFVAVGEESIFRRLDEQLLQDYFREAQEQTSSSNLYETLDPLLLVGTS